MNRLPIFFIYALLLTLLLPPFFSSLKLLFFAPFLVLAFYQKDKISCLWLALFCGLIIDLLSAHTRLGNHALNYCLTVSLLYGYKRHFFEDSLTTLPIMTYLFAFLSAIIEASLLYVFSQKIPFSWEWLASELLWMPLQEACYAGLAFTLPALLLPKAPKRQTVLFSSKSRP